MGILKTFLTSALLKKLVIAGLGFLAVHFGINHIAGIDATAIQATTDTLGVVIAGTLAHALHLADPDSH